MYRLMIVDDEKSVRDGIATLLNRDQMDIELCGQAVNGAEALSMLSKAQPDIVICDVKMPRMNGILFVSHALSQLPHLQVIFISGYSDKQYLKSAIQFGAVDYIDKPFEAFELIEALERAKQYCQKNRQTMFDTGLALSLVTGKHHESLARQQNLQELMAHYAVACILLGPGCEETSSPASMPLLVTAHYGLVRDALHKATDQPFLLSPTADGYVLIFSACRQEDILQSMAALMRGLEAQEIFAYIGVSNLSSGPDAVRQAYGQSLEASRCLFYDAYGRIMSYANLPRKAFEQNSAAEQRIFLAMHQGEGVLAAKHLSAYIDTMRDCACEYIPVIRNVLTGIARHLCADAKSSLEAVTLLSSMRTLGDMERGLAELIGKRINALDGGSRTQQIVRKACAYIDDHYATISSIQEIAANCYVSTSHMCYLFKQNMGMTIGEYIANTKLTHALHLLKDPFVKVHEVSEQLGFCNPDYFSRLFYRRFHQTPREYRNARR